MSYSLAFSQAIVMLIYIADKIAQGYFEFISAQQIADDLNIAPSVVTMILRRLNRAGIIETREGARGGSRLSVPPSQVTALDVFQAIEQERPLFQLDLRFRVTGKKPNRAQRAVADLFSSAEAAMKASLMEVTIAELVEMINV